MTDTVLIIMYIFRFIIAILVMPHCVQKEGEVSDPPPFNHPPPFGLSIHLVFPTTCSVQG